MNNNLKKENSLVNLIVNILIPVLILTKGADKLNLSPGYGLVIALSFPLGYGIYDLITRKKTGLFSILGFISVLFTGVIGLLEYPAEWIAYKEATIPFIIGMVAFISGFTPFPIAGKILYIKEIFDIEKIESVLDPIHKDQFDRIFNRASIFLGLSFFLSSILNFFLAEILIKSPPGTLKFNEELGKMTFLSLPVIVLPSMIVVLLVFWYIVSSIKKLSVLSMDEILSIK